MRFSPGTFIKEPLGTWLLKVNGQLTWRVSR
jgi:hypothetical protein